MDFSFAFIEYFLHGLFLFAPLVSFLMLIIIGLGQIVGRIESWSRFNAFYWSLITAMTVGYGDIRPVKTSSKSLSLAIAFTGLILTGVTVAIAIEAASKAFVQYGDKEVAEKIMSKK